MLDFLKTTVDAFITEVSTGFKKINKRWKNNY